jgi:hypothetical protein
MKPTPGPWKIEKSEQGGYFVRGDINGQSFEVVCDIPEARKADLNLIVASPDLFGCVAAFVRKFGFDVECDEAISGANAVDWIAENMPEFRNALKKARGLR